MDFNKVYLGDCKEVLQTFPDACIDCCVTSPPYFAQRDYGVDGQIGLEDTPEAYIERLTEVFMEVYRVLKPNGTLWLNVGDTYAWSVMKLSGCKRKDCIGIPWMLAFSLRNAGWYLRQDIIWEKSNPMPESVRDRCTKAHEYIFLLSKSRRYYFDSDAIKEPAVGFNNDLPAGSPGQKIPNSRRRKENAKTFHGGGNYTCGRSCGNSEDRTGLRNKRSVWTVSTQPTREAHFATFPAKLIEPCILAGCPREGVVLDPFIGSGTTGIVAGRLERNFVGIELNPEYQQMAERRIFNKG